jgi:predicted AAA+ superfamily ATPase
LVSDIEEVAGKTLKSIKNERIFVFMDEVQKVPEIFDTVKWIHDDFGDNIKFLFSGSSTLNLYQRVSESLAGRTEIINVFPFTLKEALHFSSGKDLTPLTGIDYLTEKTLDEKEFDHWCQASASFKRTFEREWENLILYGFLPGIFHLETEKEKWEYLSNFRHTYIEKDIRDILNIGSLMGFNKLLSILANRTSNLLDYSNMANLLKLNRKTVAKYMNILLETFIAMELQPFFKKIEKRVVKTPKIYFLDSGIRNQISGSFSSEILEDRGEIGKVLEQVISVEVFKLLHYSGHPFNIYFYRTHGGAEIDMVMEVPRGIVLIEINKGKKIGDRAIRSFMEEWKGKSKTGFVVSSTESPEIIAPGLYRITPWMLLT